MTVIKDRFLLPWPCRKCSELVNDENGYQCSLSEDGVTCDTFAKFEAASESESPKGWDRKALAYCERVGIYEYQVNGHLLEYWTFYGQSEGWMFVRYDLEQEKEVFRGANIPWNGTIPKFLLTEDGATKYNYMEG